MAERKYLHTLYRQGAVSKVYSSRGYKHTHTHTQCSVWLALVLIIQLYIYDDMDINRFSLILRLFTLNCVLSYS